jgi:predicted RNase H-like HicB family nuclease
MRRYAIIIEKGDSGYGAFVPDLPGCVAVDKSIQETERLIKKAIEFHLEGMKEDGVEFPCPLPSLNMSRSRLDTAPLLLSTIDSQQSTLFFPC